MKGKKLTLRSCFGGMEIFPPNWRLFFQALICTRRRRAVPCGGRSGPAGLLSGPAGPSCGASFCGRRGLFPFWAFPLSLFSPDCHYCSPGSTLRRNFQQSTRALTEVGYLPRTCKSHERPTVVQIEARQKLETQLFFPLFST